MSIALVPDGSTRKMSRSWLLGCVMFSVTFITVPADTFSPLGAPLKVIVDWTRPVVPEVLLCPLIPERSAFGETEPVTNALVVPPVDVAVNVEELPRHKVDNDGTREMFNCGLTVTF